MSILVETLKKSHSFSTLADEDLNRIAEVATPLCHKHGTTIIQEGETATFFELIISGEVEAFNIWAGEELPLRTLNAGDIFGDTPYFKNRLHHNSIRATHNTETLRFNYEDLDRLFQEFPILEKHFMTHRLNEMNLQFEQSQRRQRIVEHSLKHLNTFLDLSEFTTAGEGGDGLLQRIVHMASEVLKAERTKLFLVHPESGKLSYLVSEGERIKSLPAKHENSIAKWALENNQIACIDNVTEEPQYNPQIDGNLENTSFRSMLVGVVKNIEGKVTGVIEAINKTEGNFNASDVNLFKAFTHQVSFGIEHYFLLKRLVSSNDKLAIMLDVLDSITQAENIAQLVEQVVDKTKHIVNCEGAAFFILNRDNNELWSLKALGDEIHKVKHPANKGLAGYCATESQSLNLDNPRENTYFDAHIDQPTAHEVHSIITVPVLNKSHEVVGVLQASNHKTGSFNNTDIDILETMCSQIGEALKRVSFLDTVLHSNKQLEELVAERTRSLQIANEELSQKNLELKKVNNNKNEFLGIAAHDLRNPLSGIASSAKMLRAAFDPSNEFATFTNDERQELAYGIEQSSHHMFQLIDDLLSAEAIDTGEIQLNLKETDLSLLIKDVIALNQRQADSKQISIEFLPKIKPTLSLDPQRFKEVLDNLISNGIKYSYFGKRIVITLDDTLKNQIQIHVADDGVGIEAKEQPKLFTKFGKLSSRPTAEEASTGLGLYIAKKLVDLHQGTIRAQSEWGVGTTFSISLPLH